MEMYQVVVLSGGGSKGPYGLGVLLAMERYLGERKRNPTRIYCGTSVGALNATLAAQGQLDKLRALYARLTTRDILGTDDHRVGKLKLWGALRRKPFYYFENAALKKTIEENASFSSLKNSHLLICATNYLTGALETFYTSDLVDEFLQRENKLPSDARRLLTNYHRIKDEAELVQALLASTAIPFYFPPVRIGGSLYVDGGVGNNTPLRQGAYMYRFIQQTRCVHFEPTVSVINDPRRFKVDEIEANLDIFGVVRRTMDIFHNEIVSDSRFTWDRNNHEAVASRDVRSQLSSLVVDLPAEHRTRLTARMDEIFATAAIDPRRVEIPLLDIRPSLPLLDDVLCFQPGVSKRIKLSGVADCLRALEDRQFITHNDHMRLAGEIQ
jgi:hypothetical protein